MKASQATRKGSIDARAQPPRLLGSLSRWIALCLAVVVTAGYESHFANILGAGFHEIAPYLLMILVLLIQPYGLFGTRKVERI